VIRAALVIVMAVTLTGCEREQRRFAEPAPASGLPSAVQASELRPGGGPRAVATQGPYDGNAWAISEGKRAYEAFNCVGCHSHGGGGMGPALMDDRWIYGSDAANIFATIVEGRPNGMPSFRGKIPNQQVWQIVAYVRSLSGQTPKGARPQRDDHLYGALPPAMSPPQPPKAAGSPP
jgi:cytochrome c oxidase cbb3-type subunit 3